MASQASAPTAKMALGVIGLTVAATLGTTALVAASGLLAAPTGDVRAVRPVQGRPGYPVPAATRGPAAAATTSSQAPAPAMPSATIGGGSLQLTAEAGTDRSPRSDVIAVAATLTQPTLTRRTLPNVESPVRVPQAPSPGSNPASAPTGDPSGVVSRAPRTSSTPTTPSMGPAPSVRPPTQAPRPTAPATPKPATPDPQTSKPQTSKPQTSKPQAPKPQTPKPRTPSTPTPVPLNGVVVLAVRSGDPVKHPGVGPWTTGIEGQAAGDASGTSADVQVGVTAGEVAGARLGLAGTGLVAHARAVDEGARAEATCRLTIARWVSGEGLTPSSWRSSVSQQGRAQH